MENNKISQKLYNYVVTVLGTEPHYSDLELNIHTWTPLENVYFMIEMAQNLNNPSITINDIQEPAYLQKMYQIIGYCEHHNQREHINLVYDFTK